MGWLLKRWWFWAGPGFVLVAIVSGYLLIPVGEGRISQANVDKIQPGWTMEQVQALLGPPEMVEGLGTSWYWFDEDGNRIAVQFKWKSYVVVAASFAPTPLNAYERLKGRCDRRIRAFWP